MKVLKTHVREDIASKVKAQVGAFSGGFHVSLPVEVCIKEVVQPDRYQRSLGLGIGAEPETKALPIDVGLPHKSHIGSILSGESFTGHGIPEVPPGVVPDEGIAESVLSSI